MKIGEIHKETKGETERPTAPKTPKTSCMIQKSFARISKDNCKLFSALLKTPEQQQNTSANGSNNNLHKEANMER